MKYLKRAWFICVILMCGWLWLPINTINEITHGENDLDPWLPPKREKLLSFVRIVAPAVLVAFVAWRLV